MALLDRLRQELDRAGRQASRAFDEGKLRLELYRAKQSLDRFAQRFGFASYRARKAGGEMWDWSQTLAGNRAFMIKSSRSAN